MVLRVTNKLSGEGINCVLLFAVVVVVAAAAAATTTSSESALKGDDTLEYFRGWKPMI